MCSAKASPLHTTKGRTAPGPSLNLSPFNREQERGPCTPDWGCDLPAYRFHVQVIGRGCGRSATAAAAYRAAELIIDQRTGETHDYRRKGGIFYCEIILPPDAPEWMRARALLWNA